MVDGFGSNHTLHNSLPSKKTPGGAGTHGRGRTRAHGSHTLSSTGTPEIDSTNDSTAHASEATGSETLNQGISRVPRRPNEFPGRRRALIDGSHHAERGVLVRAARARQRGGRALGAVVARRARVARRLTSQLLEGARCALDAHVSCRDWLLYCTGTCSEHTAPPRPSPQSTATRRAESTTCRDWVGDALAQGVEVAGESEHRVSSRSGWRWCRPGSWAGARTSTHRYGAQEQVGSL